MRNSAETGPSLSYNKLCLLEDFQHPRIRHTIRKVFHHDLARFGPAFPRGREYRKHWEVAMALLALQDYGALHDEAEILGVGAGNEPTIFWLTNIVRRVFATDLYLGADWRDTASETMLIDPGRHWPGPWQERRLVVQHMDARHLRYEDGSLDGIFSSSSLEHLGDLDDVSRSLDEMCRVLRPGGVASLSTEYRLAGEPPGLPGVLMFDAKQLTDTILGNRPWRLITPLDLTVTPATLATATDYDRAAADMTAHLAAHGGVLRLHELEWSQYPHILLRHQSGLLWGSVHLALRKMSEVDEE